MIHLLKTFLGILFLTGMVLPAHSAKSPIKLGKISDDLLKIDYKKKYPNADAVVLADFGDVAINYIKGVGWQYTFERECRIKIINDEGYDWASVEIKTYDDNNVEEELVSVKGFTYNLEHGKVVKEKLTNSSIFEEKSGKYYKKKKFTMPDVREGSIVEFSYRIISNYLTVLPEWKFQKSIPVEWSELYVEIPEYFNYLKLSQGYGSFTVNEVNSDVRTITFMGTYNASSNQFSPNMKTYSESEDYQVEIQHWVARDVAPLKSEKYIGNPDDFRLGLEFQLSFVRSSNGSVDNVLGSWEDVNRKLLDEVEDFGPNMRARNFYKDLLEVITSAHQEPEDRLVAIYQHVSQHLKWNEDYGYIPDNNLRKCYAERVGNAAEINGILVSMLRAADIKAEPVIISTRSHGLVNPAYPIMDKFNYLIAAAWLGDQVILMDATEGDLPPGMLPQRCLNGKGRVIASSNPGWIDLQPVKGFELKSSSMVKINAEGHLCGTVERNWTGYGAMDIADDIRTNGEENYREEVKKDHEQWEIRKLDIVKDENSIHEIKEHFEVEIKGSCDIMGDMMYITPVLNGKLEKNPFKEEERKLPVDFTFPVNSYNIVNLMIPEGYVVEELPQSIIVNNPDKSITFKYLVKDGGSNIQIITHFAQSRTFYTPEEYPHIRELYAMAVSKYNEQVVLKKAPSN